jgi:hypothetical protein
MLCTGADGTSVAMKDQYAGDVNDFGKYALLRALAASHGGSLNVCWMLTAPDGRRDGGRVAYLRAPDAFRDFDPLLFDRLATLVDGGTRSVAAVQQAHILPRARFHPPMLTDALAARNDYFEGFWSTLAPEELVFFDPDNGLEVASVPKGRRRSAKYLYWDELERSLGGGRSVCVYQHFPRVSRGPYVAAMLDRMTALRPDHEAFAVTTSSVAYLICVPARRYGALRAATEALVRQRGSPLALVYQDRRPRPGL